jgi:hypothetical protein
MKHEKAVVQQASSVQILKQILKRCFSGATKSQEADCYYWHWWLMILPLMTT